MLKYIGRRLGQLIPTLLGVSVLVFFGMHLVPGDVAQLLLGDKGTEADLQRLRHQLGLDQPVYVQYLRFLLGAVRGDFRVSLRTRQPAIWEIGQALPVTIQLSIAALLLAVVLGLAIGVAAARRPHSALDTGAMLGVLIGVAMPVFWTGILLLLVFGGIFGWLPLGGILSEGMTLRRITGMPLVDGLLSGNAPAVLSSIRHLILPAIALGATSMATIARMARSTMLEVLHLDYVRTARAKGGGERRGGRRHALRTAPRRSPGAGCAGAQTSWWARGSWASSSGRRSSRRRSRPTTRSTRRFPTSSGRRPRSTCSALMSLAAISSPAWCTERGSPWSPACWPTGLPRASASCWGSPPATSGGGSTPRSCGP